MERNFEIRYSQEAVRFLDQLNEKARRKILYNIDRSSYSLDPRLFKKISFDLWEFRTRYDNAQYRILAFWDKREGLKTLVVATNGLIKKTRRIPRREIEKAVRIRESYYKT